MAAEIGQSLVEENNALKAKLLSKDSLDYIQQLETHQADLLEQLDSYKQAVHTLKESEKNALHLLKEMELAQLESTASFKQSQLEMQEYKEKYKHMKLEYESLQVKHLQSVSDPHIPVLNKRIHELSDKVEILESELKESNHSFTEVSQHAKELERLNQEYMEYRSQSQEKSLLIQDLQSALAANQEQLLMYQHKLQKYEQGSQVTQEAPKTLLSEVEEKRIQAEEERFLLQQKHQGLLKNTVIQQERMRNHISRLTQLSQNQSAEHRVFILEQELSQALSDNQELETRLLQMDKSSRRSSFKEDQLDSHTISDESHRDVENLLLRVNQLIQENDKLSLELKTLHLIKLNEADKVRTAYDLLHERETELDQTRCQLAQTRFELQEFQRQKELCLDDSHFIGENVIDVDDGDSFTDLSFIEKDENDEIHEKDEKNENELTRDETSIESIESSDVQSTIDKICKENQNIELQKAIDAAELDRSSPEQLHKRKSTSVSTLQNPSSKMIKIQKTKNSNECNQQ